MRAYDVIYKKRNGGKLTKEEIDFFIRAFTSGDIPDYQASAFLMAVFIRGMEAKETTFLTQAMAESGRKLNLSSIPGIKVDKHSTGGVGDGISLVLAPLVAACGVPVPMMSGRGLGHTGGTLDKLESIPNFRINLTEEEMTHQLKKIGLVMIGQSADYAPADKKFYALRDVTACVESIPLIAASILSKKLAEGCDALVMDIKMGDGAFMREEESAVGLAKLIMDIGKRSGKRVVSLVTDMQEPLGGVVGNSLEIEQAVEILGGKEKSQTRSFIELTEALGGWMLFLGGVSKNSGGGKEMIRQARINGSGLAKFRALVTMQGGDPKVCDHPQQILPRAQYVKTVASPWKGFIAAMNARYVGIASLILGAGREKQESTIDHSVGIVLHKKAGERVERGEAIADFHYSDSAKLPDAERTFLAGLKIGRVRPKITSVIHQVIR